MLEALESQGYLQTNSEYGSVCPTEKARGVLFDDHCVYMRTAAKTKALRTIDAFLSVNGVGQYKAEQYGEVFLSEINRYLDGEHND